MRVNLPTIEGLEAGGKKILVRVDFNVPMNDEGAITDDTRIKKSLSTLEFLLNKGASLVLASHLGRPKGKDGSLSLKPIAAKLQEYLPNAKVIFAGGDINEASAKKAKGLEAQQVLVLENVRFYGNETSKDKSKRSEFAKRLAAHADAYVDDAFGACHREHASIVEITELLPSYAGMLLNKEIEVLQKILSNPPKPFIAIIGGSKISSKIAVLEHLVKKVDAILIGGAMAYTFLKSRLVEIGDSMVEKEFLSKAFQIIDKADYNRCEFHLPDDHIVAAEFSASAKAKTVGKGIPDGLMGMDIGPKTADKYSKIIKGAQTVLWNGPMGVFEMESFAKGTMKIAKALTKVKGTTVVGGGDSVYAVKQAGVEDQMTHISTGGGATLEYLEGKKLPGVQALIQDE